MIWTPSSGGNTTKHVTQRSTSPTSQEQIRNPVECTFRCCPALILLMPPGFATLRQTTRTTHHQLSKTTHSITDIRPVTYVQRMRLAKHGRHLSVAHHQDNTTASDKKTHTMHNLRKHAAWWRQRDPEYGSLRSQCPQHMFGQYMHMFDIIGTWSGSAKHTHAKSHNTCGTLHPILLVAQLLKRISMNNLCAEPATAIATLNPHSLL